MNAATLDVAKAASANTLSFSETSHDKIMSIVSHGDTVKARVRAVETTGVVQILEFTYTVRAGIITSGQQTLVAQHPAAGQSG